MKCSKCLQTDTSTTNPFAPSSLGAAAKQDANDSVVWSSDDDDDDAALDDSVSHQADDDDEELLRAKLDFNIPCPRPCGAIFGCDNVLVRTTNRSVSSSDKKRRAHVGISKLWMRHVKSVARSEAEVSRTNICFPLNSSLLTICGAEKSRGRGGSGGNFHIGK